jgi:hypothetical protein
MSQRLTLHQFNQLSNAEKNWLLEYEGAYLQTFRIEGNYKVALFSLYDYYVEVWLNQSTDELMKASAFLSSVYNLLVHS